MLVISFKLTLVNLIFMIFFAIFITETKIGCEHTFVTEENGQHL